MDFPQNLKHWCQLNVNKCLVPFSILQVESIVLKRYGRDAYRMFRLLSKASRLLETDNVIS